MINKRFLLVCRTAPYGAARAREALDMALAAAAFDQDVGLLFLGDGVWQLVRGQNPEAIGQKAFDKQLGSLPLYSIDRLYVDAQALDERALAPEDLVLPTQPLSSAAIAVLLKEQDVVLGF